MKIRAGGYVEADFALTSREKSKLNYLWGSPHRGFTPVRRIGKAFKLAGRIATNLMVGKFHANSIAHFKAIVSSSFDLSARRAYAAWKLASKITTNTIIRELKKAILYVHEMKIDPVQTQEVMNGPSGAIVPLARPTETQPEVGASEIFITPSVPARSCHVEMLVPIGANGAAYMIAPILARELPQLQRDLFKEHGIDYELKARIDVGPPSSREFRDSYLQVWLTRKQPVVAQPA